MIRINRIPSFCVLIQDLIGGLELYVIDISLEIVGEIVWS